MMDSRLWPRTTPWRTVMPDWSGPRWDMARSMASTWGRRSAVHPAMAHMVAFSPSPTRRGARSPVYGGPGGPPVRQRDARRNLWFRIPEGGMGVKPNAGKAPAIRYRNAGSRGLAGEGGTRGETRGRSWENGAHPGRPGPDPGRAAADRPVPGAHAPAGIANFQPHDRLAGVAEARKPAADRVLQGQGGPERRASPRGRGRRNRRAAGALPPPRRDHGVVGQSRPGGGLRGGLGGPAGHGGGAGAGVARQGGGHGGLRRAGGAPRPFPR